jgi:hypothetical protein
MGWSFTTHQALFMAPLPGIEEEEAPTSTIHSHINYRPAVFFWRRCRGGSRRLLRGEFHTHILYFVLLFCFTLFILPASFYIKNPKKLESLVVVISLL